MVWLKRLNLYRPVTLLFCLCRRPVYSRPCSRAPHHRRHPRPAAGAPRPCPAPCPSLGSDKSLHTVANPRSWSPHPPPPGRPLPARPHCPLWLRASWEFRQRVSPSPQLRCRLLLAWHQQVRSSHQPRCSRLLAWRQRVRSSHQPRCRPLWLSLHPAVRCLRWTCWVQQGPARRCHWSWTTPVAREPCTWRATWRRSRGECFGVH